MRTKQSKKKQRKSEEEETRDSLFEQSIILAWKSRTSLHPDLSVMIRPMLPLYKTLYSSVVTVRRSSRNPRSPTTQYQPRVGIWKARGLWKKVLRKTTCCPSFLKQTAAKRGASASHWYDEKNTTFRGEGIHNPHPRFNHRSLHDD